MSEFVLQTMSSCFQISFYESILQFVQFYWVNTHTPIRLLSILDECLSIIVREQCEANIKIKKQIKNQFLKTIYLDSE